MPQFAAAIKSLRNPHLDVMTLLRVCRKDSTEVLESKNVLDRGPIAMDNRALLLLFDKFADPDRIIGKRALEVLLLFSLM